MPSDAPGSSADQTGAPRRWVNAAVIGHEAARETWALAAREKLEETARTYGAVVTYKELAQWVQERSLIRTKQLHMHWIGDVLGRVSMSCVERREPLLSALCVDARGHVGPGYAIAVEAQRGAPLGDPDDHAAHERLACYRWHGTEMPPGGGEPVVTVRAAPPRVAGSSSSRGPGGRVASPRAATPSRTAAPRSAKASASTPEKPLAVCPVHFTVLPATGVCDDCD